MSPLGWAIATHRFDIVYLLIDKGADYKALGLGPHVSVIDYLAGFDLDMIIEAGEADEELGRQKESEMRDWYFKVVRLLQKKGVSIQRQEVPPSHEQSQNR